MNQPCKSNFVFGKSSVLALTLILLLGLGSVASGNIQIDAPQPMSDEEAATLSGGMQWGACGIVAGIAIGILALGVAGVSVGMGSAAVISVGAHVAAAICID
jgi:hypothetical protein